jgi:DNA-binding MarR family transcriptional regulator
MVILSSVYELLYKKERSGGITRKELIELSGVNPSIVTRRIKNNYLKEKLLKEKIK